MGNEQGGTSYQLSNWKPNHGMIAQLHVQGHSSKDIADRLGFSPNTISRLITTPLMKAEIARLQGNLENIMVEADLRMKSLLHRSLDIIEENLGEPKAGITPKARDREKLTSDAWKVIEAVLKIRAGGPGVQIQNVLNVQQVIEEAKSMSSSDLVKDVVKMVRASHDDG